MEAARGGIIDLAVVEDHVVLQHGLHVLLERRGCRIVGTASTVKDALEMMDETRPDVMVVDLHLPDGSGSDLVRTLLRAHPDLRAVIYTGLIDPEVLAQAMECGAQGLVLKQARIDELVEAIRDVRRGERYFDPRLTEMLKQVADDGATVLSRRQQEILVLLAQGSSGEEIALRLSLSGETVRTHVRNAMKRLNARTRTHAVVEALERHEIRA